MPERLASSEFARRHDLPDWRILLRSVEGWFVAPSFSAGAAFVDEVARAADAAGHHPDLDLRYPGRVHILITSHDVHGLSDRDAELAARISALAAASGLTAEPLASTRLEVAIDAMDIDAVRPFWAAVLGYKEEPPFEEGYPVDAISDPAGIGPAFWFQQMDEPRSQRNRFHIDVTVPSDEADARIEAALAAGGTMVSDAAARAWWILADPEGNEACVCTCEDRDRVAVRGRPAVASSFASGASAPDLDSARTSRTLRVRTYSPKASEITRKWYVVDAEDLVLGRLSTEVARILRGKHKPTFAPHMDMGDHVIVINAEKVVLTSNKADQKLVYRHSGYPGGLKSRTFAEALALKPEEGVRRAVRGMLPKNRLGRQMLTKLKVYAGPNHPHSAQMPEPLDLAAARRTA